MKGSLVGHIIGGPANPDYDGAVLTANLSVGDTLLHVDDTADFDEDAADRGAMLLLGVDLGADGNPEASTGTAVAYQTAYDEDGIATYGAPPTEHTGTANTVALVAASTVTASTGDRIYLQDPVSGGCVGRVEVQVAIDNGDQTGDSLSAYVDVQLLESVGDVDLTDLAVDLDEDEDGQLYVAGFPGLVTRQGAIKFMQDETTALGPGGVVELDLTYIPIKNSEHLYIGGVYQRGAVWTRDRWKVSIPDSGNQLATGNKIAMEYAYTDPATSPPPTFSGPTAHALSGNWNSYPTSFITSIPLPTGTVIGDLLVVISIGSGGAGGDSTIGDPRLTTIVTDTVKTIAVGYATNLTDVQCHVGGAPYALDQFAGIEVLSVHGDGVNPLAYDPARIATFSPVAATSGSIGSVGGSGHGVIAVVGGAYGNTITLDMPGKMPAYADWGGSGVSSVLGHFGYCATEPPPSQTNPTNAPAVVALIGLR